LKSANKLIRQGYQRAVLYKGTVFKALQRKADIFSKALKQPYSIKRARCKRTVFKASPTIVTGYFEKKAKKTLRHLSDKAFRRF